MVLKYEGKRLREVKDYSRKSRGGRTHIVGSYFQRYDKPRGSQNTLKIDALTPKSKTAWLKDSSGRFVGRANSKGQTTAKRYKYAKVDETSNKRETGKYGRIYGRSTSRSRR